MEFRVNRATCSILCLLAATATTAAQENSRQVQLFNEKIQPIIFKSCNGCHTYGGHAGGLRMDTYAAFLKGGDRGPIFVPGNPKASRIMKAVLRSDEKFMMPPMRPIMQADIAILEDFILHIADAGPGAPPEKLVSANQPAKAAVPMPDMPVVLAKSTPAAISDPTPEQEKFFESKIRPLLTKHCYTCHTRPATSGLRLDSQEAILNGGAHGPAAVPGHADESLLIQAVRYKSKLQMPPAGTLKAEEIAALEQWVSEGMPWPKPVPTPITSKVTEAQRNFWSFRAPVKPAIPSGDAKWSFNTIDRFVSEKLKEKGLKPVPDADRRTLIRRLSFDLTGLPPKPQDVLAFVNDKSPDAYATLINKMLDSPEYGERWGRKWLDIVRYGDTTGGDGDFPVPQAVKYRDYVIKSFREDKPYDRFLREQIAGDLLPAKSEEERWNNIVATGYLATTVRADGKEAYTADAVDNLGSAFLGLTVGCARCHDHKFDPIPTADYYSLFGILRSTKLAEGGQGNQRFQRGFTYRDTKTYEREDYKIFEAQLKPVADAILAVRKLPGTYDDLVPQLEARRMHLFAVAPKLGESAYAASEGEPVNVRIQKYGDPKDLGPEVPRGFLQVLGGGPLPAGTKGSGRLELAEWLLSKDNPLTARVIVNRIWQGHFGAGIVATANDFGIRGVAPANQQLLDYLATKFVESGWSLKALHREILLSHTYQLSSKDDTANSLADPTNSYNWRHSRLRLDAEQVRDSLLATSGLLDPTPGGEHPFPPPHEWNYEDQNQFAPVMADYENNKRTVYMMVPRSTRLPYFNIFDGPNVNVSTDQRTASITPLQALYFMNAPFPKQAASKLATQLSEQKASEKELLQNTFLSIFGRAAHDEELERALNFLHRAKDVYATRGVKQGTPQSNAWSDFIQAMYASNEFMFID